MSYCNILYNLFVVDDEDNAVDVSCHDDPIPPTTTTVTTAPVSVPPSAAFIHSGKPVDTDPLVLHVLPPAVTVECESVHLHVCV